MLKVSTLCLCSGSRLSGKVGGFWERGGGGRNWHMVTQQREADVDPSTAERAKN